MGLFRVIICCWNLGWLVAVLAFLIEIVEMEIVILSILFNIGILLSNYSIFINNMISILFLLLVYIGLVVILQFKKSKQPGQKTAKKIAFFHPFCNDGGGGEKVLWSMIEALFEQKCPTGEDPIISIYSLENDSHEILLKVSNRFNIHLSQYAHKINFIHVKGREYLTPKPKLTMLCHIFLPMIYCFQCLWKHQPDVFYDTTGFAFNFILVKLLLPNTQCRAYVHYPFISEDMVAKIRERRADYNNDASISQSAWKTKIKLIYYQLILLAYKFLRFTVKQAQANSSWTQAHMVKLWGPNITKLYPPCVLNELLKFEKKYESEQLKLMSLAQFRPQKNHVLQIDVINNIVKRLSVKTGVDAKVHLYICGTTRGAEDEKLLQSLQGKVQLMKLQKHITFCVNMKFAGLLAKLQECNYGIHSMEAEHFGISVVEMLAAGCLIVAHNSAGPKLDIIKDERFLASSPQEYEQKVLNVLLMKAEEKKKISKQFRERMKQFGQVSFKQNFRNIFYGLKQKSK